MPASVFCAGLEACPADRPLLRQLADHWAFSLRSVPWWVNTRPAEMPASVFCTGFPFHIIQVHGDAAPDPDSRLDQAAEVIIP